MMTVIKSIEFYPAVVGIMSCVGITSKDYPVGFGNYFWINDGPRIINMWGENLAEAARRFNMDSVECTVFRSGKYELAFITDERIPKSWLYNKLCVTGYGWGNRELCEACLDFAGLENDWNYCGCEKPEQSPKLYRQFIFNDNISIYNCYLCGRKETRPWSV